MYFKAVVFDLDGTLLDTLEDIAHSANTVLARRGFPTHSLDDYRYFVGEGVTTLITRVLPDEKRNDDTIAECVRAFREEYGRNWNVKTTPYDGVPQMLDELASRHLKLAVLSNKPDDFTKKCVTELLPDWTFEIVLGLHSGIPPKPDPTGASQVAEYLSVPPSRILYVGDSGIDMKTAIAAGMFPLGVLWGFRSQEELQDNGAQALISRPQEILAVLY
ncbi:MAG: HAD family hydrolase [Dehalococcoidia bacterium]|nr:Phosphoglycolate phosphatase [Chloroflexota bacterium]MBT9160211.1 Phosphoglycolate phosphatase [Chloroflexota bacterium]MBT9161591.1 Phosphoglycolate phosphatase [Chloroflexota bacterium]